MDKVFVARRIVGLDHYLDHHKDKYDLDIWEDDSNAPSPQVLIERAKPCKAVVSMITDKLDQAFFDALPNLRIVSQYGVGVNNIDLNYARSRGIQVGHTPDVLTDATADMAWALLMASARNIAQGVAYIRAGHWKRWEPALMLGKSVFGATLGIIGYGRIGRAVASRSRGFEMKVIVHHTHPVTDQWVTQSTLEAVLEQSDFIVLTVPLKADTHHLIGQKQLALIKTNATLINVSRGAVVDTDALLNWLREEKGFAALDVTDPEPLPADHPLTSLPNCLVVPHLGSSTMQARLAMTELAMKNLELALAGHPMQHCANP